MVDYSKWKTIELSSDEDDVHPFIENGTLFRLRHEARMKKMEERKQAEFAMECQKASYLERLEKVKTSMALNESEGKSNDELIEKMKELEIEENELKEKEEKLNKQVVAWYKDTICHPGYSKMYINNAPKDSEDFVEFTKQNEEILRKFGLLKTFDETKHLLLEHPYLMCRNTVYFLISYAIELYMFREKEKLRNVSRQIVCLDHILELFKRVSKNRKDIVINFFQNVSLADEETRHDFKKETVKVEKLIKEMVKEQLQEGDSDFKEDDHTYALSAEEVFKSLPEDMQYCFLTSDKEALAGVLSDMPKEQSDYHMQRCIDSGLWVPTS